MAATEPSPEITYRFLEADEFSLVAPVFEANGVRAPSPQMAAIYAAVAGDRIVGFHCLQLVAHAEPVHVAEAWRGRVDWRELVAGVEQLMSDGGFYVVCASDERVAAMCEKTGMREVPGRLYIKQF